jgi:hypothetical protein
LFELTCLLRELVLNALFSIIFCTRLTPPFIAITRENIHVFVSPSRFYWRVINFLFLLIDIRTCVCVCGGGEL